MKTDLHKIRRWHGYSQKQIGELIGAHHTTVCMIELGKRELTRDQADALEPLRKKMIAEMRRELAR
jgi:DNA-binding XRE family transcriptional regulator